MRLPQLESTGSKILQNLALASQIKNESRRLTLAEQAAETTQRSADIEYETNVLTIGNEYLKRVRDKDDYVGYRQYMVDKYQMNPDLLPESFDTDEEFESWRNRATMTVSEWIKVNQGEPITMSKVNEDGTIRSVEAKNREEMLDFAQQGFDIGETKGTPRKTLSDIKAEETVKAQVKQEYSSPKSEAELTRAALKGDEESKQILSAMQERKVEVAKASGEAVIDARIGVVDVEGAARAVLDGRETIENVKNTFGVPVQEAVRAAVLEQDPEFNFVKPRVKLASVKSSLMQQQKQRGMMGSFVKNLNKQLGRVDTIAKDVISRVGVRAVDLPLRELNVRFKGSGHERVLEAYLLEISNEIGKLSTGSAASIRELSVEAQARWDKIHDPNLSFNELRKILEETNEMANMRLDSTDEEIEETLGMLDNIREPRKKEKLKDPLGIR